MVSGAFLSVLERLFALRRGIWMCACFEKRRVQQTKYGQRINQYIYICIYIYIYIRTYVRVCMYIFMYVCMWNFLYTCSMNACLWLLMHGCMHAFRHSCLHLLFVCLCACMLFDVCMCIEVIQTHACMLHTCKCIHPHILCMHAHAHTPNRTNKIYRTVELLMCTHYIYMQASMRT